MRGKLWIAGAAVAALIGSSPAVASVVVVKSLGPSAKAYPPGKTLPESAKITLQGGDVVTVLGPAAAQTLRGPGNFAAGQMTLASAESKRGRFGALRASDLVKNPSIWDVDVTQSGKMCVTNASKLQLWRPETETAAKISIRSSDGKSQDVDWAAGKASVVWPAALPITSGSEYQIEWPETGDKSSVTFVTVPNAPTDVVGAAQVLIENGCQHQLDLLVQSASSKTGN
jgi:hypothetical protein